MHIGGFKKQQKNFYYVLKTKMTSYIKEREVAP